MLFAETSDVVLIVNALIALVGTIFAGIMAYLMAKLTRGQVEVAQALETTTAVADKKLDVIHEAVNGNNKRLEDKIESLTKQLQASLQREAKNTQGGAT